MIYFDSFSGPIPCEFLGHSKAPLYDVTKCYNVVINLKRDCRSYKKGEVLHVPPWAVVEIVGNSGKCKTATLPTIDIDNLIPTRGKV